MHVPEGVMTIPISCQSDGALQIFIEPVMAAPHVVIVGRSPMAVTLLDLVRDLGWRGDLIDADEFGPCARVGVLRGHHRHAGSWR